MEAGLSNNIACIIQARISSSRLPGKIALDLYGKTILERVIEQCINVHHNIDLIIATSTDPSDNITAEIGESAGVDVYRGSLLDVRSRYLNAGKGYKYIIRATADNPFTEPTFIEESIEKIKNNNCDYISISNCPYGTGVQTFKYELLEYCRNTYDDQENREHVLIEHQLLQDKNIITQQIPASPWSFPNICLSVDVIEDYLRAFMIFESLKKNNLSNTLHNVVPIYKNLFL